MGGGERSGERSDRAKVDDSVPFTFLLGEKYSGYKQAINSSKDLEVCGRRDDLRIAASPLGIMVQIIRIIF